MLIVIADSADRQSQEWSILARYLGVKVQHLLASDCGQSWHVEVGSAFDARVVVGNDELSVRDESIFWYLRLPHFDDHAASISTTELHSALARVAFPQRRYMQTASLESTLQSKPLNVMLAGPNPCPTTYLLHKYRSGHLNENDHVVKSISLERSTVVKANDTRLNTSVNRGGPVQLQESIRGLNVKVHAYLRRDMTWNLFPIAVVSEFTDYREDADIAVINYHDNRFVDAARHIHQLTGMWWFDFDVILAKSLIFFLEANWSPAPRFYETKLPVCSANFSRELLCDWLML